LTDSTRTMHSTEFPLIGAHWPVVPESYPAKVLGLLFQLEQSQWLSPERLRERQFGQIARLLAHAAGTVPFYRDRLDALDLTSPEALSPERWHDVPILSRRDIQHGGTALYSTGIPKDHGRTSEISTGGSTGQPVKVRCTGLTELYWRAFALRDHCWHRRDLSQQLAAIRYTSNPSAQPPDGETLSNWGSATRGIIQTGPGALLSVKSDVEQQAQWLKRRNPAYLMCYPTCALALARLFAERRETVSQLREIRTFGEIVEPNVRQAWQEAWGVPVVDVYSTGEVGYVALQCPEHEHYHVQSENVLVEILDEQNRPCSPGEIGRVVITTLHNFAMPLIRYEIGDYAEVGERCPCGRSLPVLNRILGRQRNMLLLPDGRRRWPSLEHVEGDRDTNLPPIGQMQVVQKTREEIEVNLVAARALSTDEESVLMTHLTQALGDSFRIDFNYVTHIPRSPSGKFEDFRCEIPHTPDRSDGAPVEQTAE